VTSIKGIFGRLRGDQVAALSADVEAMREIVLNINHVVTELQATVMELNHDVRSGAERSLPLFVGYAERLRLDADTAIGATQVIERQLALVEDRLGEQAASASDASRA
jgi:hypothetical protein